MDGDGVPLGEIPADRPGDRSVAGAEDGLDKKHYTDYAAPSENERRCGGEHRRGAEDFPAAGYPGGSGRSGDSAFAGPGV